MMDRILSQVLGTDADDPGCAAVFDALDRYVEAVVRGDDVSVTYATVMAHLENCPACREDAEGLLAALREIALPRDA